MKTVYSRTIFFLFPSKLCRLKEDREKLQIDIRDLVNKYINEVDPEYNKKRIIMKDEKENNIPDFTKKESDSLEYLERRFSLTKRKTKVHLVNELNYLYNGDKLERISEKNTSQSSKKNEDSEMSDFSDEENEQKNIHNDEGKIDMDEKKPLLEKKNQ